jgi:DNA-binding NtrC family response regulator
MSAKILLVDDSEEMLATLGKFLRNEGHTVSTANSCAQAITRFEQEDPDLCLVDYELPDGTAFDILLELRKRDPKASVVVLTGHGTIGLAVEAIKLGAEHFVTKPVDLPSVGVLVDRVLHARSQQRRTSAEQRSEERTRVTPFVGSSPAVRRMQELAEAVKHSDAPVLLIGETGTGKGVLARWLHDAGPRAAEAFVDLNCAGLSRELAESELFGHQRGSFTGANATKRGLLELAHHGTLFLDEIGDLDLAVQPKLLKALEDKTYRRIGDVQTRRSDARLISATHRGLDEMARGGAFRSDLLFRINTVVLELPALRDRKQDIAELTRNMIAHFCRLQGRPDVELSVDGVAALQDYAWPGNIRELRNVVERALLFCRGTRIERQALALPGPIAFQAVLTAGPNTTLEEVERSHVTAVLQAVDGRVEDAAKLLGIPRSSLYAKLKRYGARSA